MKILVIRFSSIGDIVLTSPVLRCLKIQTGAEIHFLTKKSFAPLVESNPYVARVFSIEKSVSEVATHLQSMNYDFVVDLHGNLRSLQTRLATGHFFRKKSRTFHKLNLEKWLLVNFKIDRLPNLHIVHRTLETVAPLGVFYDGAGLDFFIPPSAEINPTDFSSTLFPEKYTAFVLGATHFTKRLPVEKMLEICLGLRKIGQPVVLLGGPTEADFGQKIAASTGAVDACGKLSLFHSASLVRQAKNVLTHDTGLMHIAAAFGKKIVSVWGSTVPKFGMTPFFADDGPGSNVTLEIDGLPCRPCSKIGFAACPKGHFRCMADQSVAKILAALA